MIAKLREAFADLWAEVVDYAAPILTAVFWLVAVITLIWGWK